MAAILKFIFPYINFFNFELALSYRYFQDIFISPDLIYATLLIKISNILHNSTTIVRNSYVESNILIFMLQLIILIFFKKIFFLCTFIQLIIINFSIRVLLFELFSILFFLFYTIYKFLIIGIKIPINLVYEIFESFIGSFFEFFIKFKINFKNAFFEFDRFIQESIKIRNDIELLYIYVTYIFPILFFIFEMLMSLILIPYEIFEIFYIIRAAIIQIIIDLSDLINIFIINIGLDNTIIITELISYFEELIVNFTPIKTEAELILKTVRNDTIGPRDFDIYTFFIYPILVEFAPNWIFDDYYLNYVRSPLFFFKNVLIKYGLISINFIFQSIIFFLYVIIIISSNISHLNSILLFLNNFIITKVLFWITYIFYICCTQIINLSQYFIVLMIKIKYIFKLKQNLNETDEIFYDIITNSKFKILFPNLNFKEDVTLETKLSFLEINEFIASLLLDLQIPKLRSRAFTTVFNFDTLYTQLKYKIFEIINYTIDILNKIFCTQFFFEDLIQIKLFSIIALISIIKNLIFYINFFYNFENLLLMFIFNIDLELIFNHKLIQIYYFDIKNIINFIIEKVQHLFLFCSFIIYSFFLYIYIILNKLILMYNNIILTYNPIINFFILIYNEIIFFFNFFFNIIFKIIYSFFMEINLSINNIIFFEFTYFKVKENNSFLINFSKYLVFVGQVVYILIEILIIINIKFILFIIFFSLYFIILIFKKFYFILLLLVIIGVSLHFINIYIYVKTFINFFKLSLILLEYKKKIPMEDTIIFNLFFKMNHITLAKDIGIYALSLNSAPEDIRHFYNKLWWDGGHNEFRSFDWRSYPRKRLLKNYHRGYYPFGKFQEYPLIFVNSYYKIFFKNSNLFYNGLDYMKHIRFSFFRINFLMYHYYLSTHFKFNQDYIFKAKIVIFAQWYEKIRMPKIRKMFKHSLIFRGARKIIEMKLLSKSIKILSYSIFLQEYVFSNKTIKNLYKVIYYKIYVFITNSTLSRIYNNKLVKIRTSRFEKIQKLIRSLIYILVFGYNSYSQRHYNSVDDRKRKFTFFLKKK